MKKINIGIIGLGRVSQIAYLNQLVKIGKINNIVICDNNIELLKKVSIKYKIFKTYSSYLNMLNNENLDLVFLLVNRFYSEKIAEKILNDKKKIILFSEKPFALSFRNARKLSDIAKKRKKTFFVGYMKRCDDGVRLLKKRINKLNLGKITSVNYFSFDGNSFENSINYIKYKFISRHKYKNSPIQRYLNTQSHSINLLQYLFGDLKYEYSNMSTAGEGTAIFKNKNGIQISLTNKFNKKTLWHEKMSLFFEKGFIDVNIAAPFFKNQKTKINYQKYNNSKNFKLKNQQANWSFTNQINLIINYTYSKKNNKKIKLYPELCSAQSCLNEFKLAERIFTK